MELLELLDTLSVDYRQFGEHHHCTPGWVSIDCVFCSPDSGHFRLGLNLRYGVANCWGCGQHPLSEVLQELTGQEAGSVRSLLRQLHFDYSESQNLVKRHGKLKLPDGLVPLLPIQREYLEKRRFDPDRLTQLYGLMGFGIHPKYAWRIFIPVYYRGDIASWLTRSLSQKEPRYLNSPPSEERLPLKSLLFGEDFVRYSAVITEGCFDAMRIGPGAVATMGVNYTTEQLVKISTFPIRCVCFDSDTPGQERAKSLCRELSLFQGETINIVLESAKDPGAADEEEIQEIRREFLEVL